jgi:hypothetical protein
MPLDIGIELRPERLQIIGIPGLNGVLDVLHVLPRHPYSGSPDTARASAWLMYSFAWTTNPSRNLLTQANFPKGTSMPVTAPASACPRA